MTPLDLWGGGGGEISKREGESVGGGRPTPVRVEETDDGGEN